MPMNIDRAVRLVRNGLMRRSLAIMRITTVAPPPVDRQSAFASGGELWVVRDEDECDPEFTNMSEQYVGDHVAGFGVERAGWLVADQQIGIAHQRSGDGHALLFASRQARRHAAHRPAPEPDGVQHARGSSSDDPQGMPPRYCNGSATFSHALRCGMRE